MPKRIVKALYLVILKLGQSLKRFPESLVFITAAAILIIDKNHLGQISSYMKEDFPRLLMILVMGFLLFLCFRVIIETDFIKNRVLKFIIWLICPSFLAVYYFILLSKLNTISIIRYIAVCVALLVTFLFVPYIKRNRQGFEMYIMKLIMGFLVTYLYAGVLCIGLVAIVFTVDQLFVMHFSGKLYFDLWIIAAGIFAPAYFLGGIPQKGTELDENSYSKVLRILFLFIVMPILSIYTLILYVYFAKVIATQQWPQGMVSNLVLWYSFVTAAIIFLTKPLLDKSLWVNRFNRVMPIAIIPLLFMCFWAMGIRIRSYGITESRYYVLVGALWVLFVFVYWIIRGGTRNVILPVSIAIIAILTIVGPQSAFSVSFRSQAARLNDIFAKNGMLKDGALVKREDISNEDKNQISSILRYIKESHGLEKLGYLPSDFQLYNAKDYLGFEIKDVADGGYQKQYYSYAIRNIKPVDISGYSFYADIRPFNTRVTGVKGIEVDYNNQTGIVSISKDNKNVYSKKISDLTMNLPRNGGKHMDMDIDELTFSDKQNGLEVLYIFRNIAFEEDSYGTNAMNDVDFSIFIK